MGLPSPWSQGLRGWRHTTAAEPECFHGEHLLFQQKCIQQGKSTPGVPRGSYSHHKRSRPHTSMESCCEERAATQPDNLSFAFPLALPLLPNPHPHPLLHPATVEPTRPCFPHLCPKREPQTAIFLPERRSYGVLLTHTTGEARIQVIPCFLSSL